MSMKEPVSFSLHTTYLFHIPELFPAQMQLLVDSTTPHALLVPLENALSTPHLRSFPLKPSAAKVLVSLLQAYPHACSHQMLFHVLYPEVASTQAQVWSWEKTTALLSIRSALRSLLPILQGCGLRAVAQRGHGYVLAKAIPPQEFYSRKRNASDGKGRTSIDGH